jgi:methyl-accepting chemotaxis protein
MNNYLKSVEKKALDVSLESVVNQGLSKYEKSDLLEKMTISRSIQSRVLALSTIDEQISEMQIIHTNGQLFGSNASVSEEDLALYTSLAAQKNGFWLKGLDGDPEAIYYLRNVNSINSGKTIAVMKVKLRSDALFESINEADILEKSTLYLSDENGQMVYNKDATQTAVQDNIWGTLTEAEGSATLDGMLVNYITLTNGWKIISEIPERSLTSKLDFTNMIVFILIGLAAILAMVCGMIVAKGFSVPIVKMMTLMKSAEQGDLTVHMDENRKDEIGMLCSSFNHMISNIRNLLKETRVVIATTVDDGKLLKDSTEHSVEAFKQLSLSISDIAAGASNQAIDTEKGTRSMYALSESIQDVMLNTKEVISKNQDAKEIIKDTTSSIMELNETMISSMQVSDQIKSSIIELSVLTKNIEEVMKMLDGISEQTNMLALNASIEAARAGDVGKGFAVVANEVKNLAEQSKASTKNVRVTLNTIQNKTKEAVDLAKNANLIITSQDQCVKNTYQSFSNIIELLKNMDTALDKVNNKINHMEEIKDDTIHKIEKIGSVTSDTVAATEEVNALSEEQNAIIEQLFDVSNKLTSTMDDLDNSIGYFKVD